MDIRSQLEEIPERLEEMDQSLTEEKEKMASVKEKEKALLVQKKDKENDLSSKETEKAKHQNELNAIKSNDAYKALLKEIDTCEKAIDQLESDIINLFDDIDDLAKEEAEEKKAVAELEKIFSEERGKLEKKQSELEAELKGDEESRGGLASSVEDGLLDRYEAVRARREGIGIAKVVDKVCAACRTRITAQMENDLNRASVLVSCEYCIRILYYPEKPPEEGKGDAAPEAEVKAEPEVKPETASDAPPAT